MLRDAIAALARRDRARMGEPDETALLATRRLRDEAAPKLRAVVSLLNRPAAWADAENDIADALHHAERALAAMERVNARLDRHGWAA